MRFFDTMTALVCAAGMVLGLVAGVSFAQTPIPDEAAGTACYDDGEAACSDINNRGCHEDNNGGECVFCDGDVSFTATYCAASTDEEECILRGGTHANCGDQFEGECEGANPPFHCDNKRDKLIEKGGCGLVFVHCSGTRQDR